jgi:Putative adhesin
MQGRRRTVAGMALLALVALAGAAACDVVFQGMNAQATDRWTRTYTLEAGGEVELVSPTGAIEVTPSADATTVEVVAERRARATSEDAARQQLKAIRITEQVTPARIRLEVPRGAAGGEHFGRSAREVNFKLRVPKTATVRVNTRNGEVRVAGVSGAVKIESTNGNIVGENLGGLVQAATTNGNVKVQVTGIHPDGVRLETTNGEIELRVPADSKATISARWSHGDFRADGIKPEGEKASRSYEGKLNGGGGRVDLRTTNGLIRISS